MTPGEAIKILKRHQKPTEWDLYDEDIKAIKLGIEALKAWKRLREGRAGIRCPALPGETEDLERRLLMDTAKAIELSKEAEKSLRKGKFHDHADAVKEGTEALEQRLKAEKEYPL